MSRYVDIEPYEKDDYVLRKDIATFCGVELKTKFIQDMPTADVAEVKHGRWNELPYSYECSVCGIIRPKEMTGKWNYCPNCGSKVDEAEE